LRKKNKHIGEEFFIFYKFAFPSTFSLTPCPAADSAATCVLCNSPINWASPQTWLSKFRSQNC